MRPGRQGAAHRQPVALLARAARRERAHRQEHPAAGGRDGAQSEPLRDRDQARPQAVAAADAQGARAAQYSPHSQSGRAQKTGD